MITENQLKQQARQWFQDSGWNNLAGDRLDILRGTLLPKQLNGELSTSGLSGII